MTKTTTRKISLLMVMMFPSHRSKIFDSLFEHHKIVISSPLAQPPPRLPSFALIVLLALGKNSLQKLKGIEVDFLAAVDLGGGDLRLLQD